MFCGTAGSLADSLLNGHEEWCEAGEPFRDQIRRVRGSDEWVNFCNRRRADVEQYFRRSVRQHHDGDTMTSPIEALGRERSLLLIGLSTSLLAVFAISAALAEGRFGVRGAAARHPPGMWGLGARQTERI